MDEDTREEDEEEVHTRMQRLSDRMRLATIAIAEGEAQRHSMEVSQPVMSALGELTLNFAQQMGRELEMFAHHASRKIVHAEDVILAARRNDDVADRLKGLAQDFARNREQQQLEKLEKKRKKPGATAKNRIEILDD